jgi:hypothetical protein
MQKLFNGKQSGIFAATAQLIKKRLPNLEISVTVEGTYIIRRKPLSGSLRGVYVSGRLEGYVRNIMISSWEGRHYTIGCEHGVEEDIGASELIFTYYPKFNLDEAIRASSRQKDDVALSNSIADIIITFDNREPDQRKMLAEFLKSQKEFLAHSSPDVRRMLTLLAKQVTRPEARHIILHALADPDDSVREMALMNLEAYGKLSEGDSIEGLLLEDLQSDNRNIRAYASENLGVYGSAQALPHLLKMACDPDDYVREAAFIAIHRLVEEGGVELDPTPRRNIIRTCIEVLAESERYVLKAAALRLLFEADNKKTSALEEAFKQVSADIDIYGTDEKFKAQLFYRSNLWSLLVEHTKWLVEHKGYAEELTNAIQKLTEDVRQLYERQRESSWSSYLRAYLPPLRKVKGQVFVNFDHDSTGFEKALKEIEPEMTQQGIHLFISKDHNPFSSENVFIPKVYRPIQESEFMLVEVSKSNLNVGYELGLAEKFNVPFALVASKQAKDLAFDLVGHYIPLTYDESSPQEMERFKKMLVDHLTRVFEEIRSKPSL